MALPIPFGNPYTYAGHSGVDFPGHYGEAIPASGPGRVSHLGRNDRGGYYIWVQYDNGPLVGYHHMNSHAGSPAADTRVSEGTRLGYVGYSGHVVPAGRAGAHLHSEVAGNATTAGYWKYFDRNRVVGQLTPAGGGGTPYNPDNSQNKGTLPVNVKLYLYVPDNRLVLVDHLNKTYHDLGKEPGDPVRDQFSREPYTLAYDRGDRRIVHPAVAWQDIVEGYQGKYRAI